MPLVQSQSFGPTELRLTTRSRVGLQCGRCQLLTRHVCVQVFTCSERSRQVAASLSGTARGMQGVCHRPVQLLYGAFAGGTSQAVHAADVECHGYEESADGEGRQFLVCLGPYICGKYTQPRNLVMNSPQVVSIVMSHVCFGTPVAHDSAS